MFLKFFKSLSKIKFIEIKFLINMNIDKQYEYCFKIKLIIFNNFTLQSKTVWIIRDARFCMHLRM